MDGREEKNLQIYVKKKKEIKFMFQLLLMFID